MGYSAEFSVEVKKHLAVLSVRPKGWQQELNFVSWNKEEPKYDIRPWNEDHSKCGKGITLTEEEMKNLTTFLANREVQKDVQ